MGEVDANLVRPPRLQPAGKQRRRRPETLLDGVAGDGIAAAGAGHGLLAAVPDITV